ncbi:MAG: response regulator [Chloroflexi bacterium]|nr:response regulator [Chloroflexota bacterium]MYD49621.1 response regulator [Chloroflexota bacterium]
MNPADPRDLETAALRERLSRLSQASQRITEDLDLDAVLQRVVDDARLLTGAGRGGLTVIDDAGQLQAFISSGLSEEAHRRIIELPGGTDLFAHLSDLSGALRVSDFSAYSEALGLPAIGPPLGPLISFLSAPVRLQGARVGNLYLSDKPGDEGFSQEDEDTLALFASQAALAIGNARRHQEERRARADLEALIDTSPIGVVVFDARTGAPVSFNREIRRIVEDLRNPDQAPEDLLEELTCRRADGREVSLREFPMAQLLSAGETVRAEEIAISVPDGRSVSALLNATPIRSEEGEVESFVVTMQDLTPLEEVERLRADFLATVSHELRAPLTSIKGSAAAVLDSATDLDPALVRQFFRIINNQADHMNELVSDLLDVARIETGSLAVNPEPGEVIALVERARNAFSTAGAGNRLEIDVSPDLPLVMADRRRIVQVLVNLLNNASRHSSPGSYIQVSATRDGVHVAVSVTDEGRGIPAEQLPHLFRRFSGGATGERAGEPAGDTGLGLAICEGIVEAHGGRIRAESDGPGLGTRFTFTLPTVRTTAGSPSALRGPRSSRRELEEVAEGMRVLAVDDDPQALRYIRDALTTEGYRPVVTGDPEEALHLMAVEQPRVALLDLMLPDTDGVELMQSIRAIADVPVIFISAYGREDLIARAFDHGAADYVVKPFSPTELAARILAALRRREVFAPLEPYVCGDLVVNFAQRRATLAGEPVPLVSLEYRLLAELAANAGRVLTYDHLLERVWNKRAGGDIRPMRAIASKLRRKLGDHTDRPTYVFTEPRVGYRVPLGETPDQEPTEDSEPDARSL